VCVCVCELYIANPSARAGSKYIAGGRAINTSDEGQEVVHHFTTPSQLRIATLLHTDHYFSYYHPAAEIHISKPITMRPLDAHSATASCQ
jgi:hypothetical protein